MERRLLVVVLLLAACSERGVRNRQVPSNLDKSVVVPAGAKAASATIPDGPGSVSNTDNIFNVPTFTWADEVSPEVLKTHQAMSHEDAALAYVNDYAARYRLPTKVAETLNLKGVHDVGTGGVIVKLSRKSDITTFDGEKRTVEVFRDELKLLMRRDHSLVAIGGFLSPPQGIN